MNKEIMAKIRLMPDMADKSHLGDFKLAILVLF